MADPAAPLLPVPPAPPARSSRGLRIALAVSVTLNLVIAGLVGGAILRDGPPGRMPRDRDLAFGPFAEALRPEDRRELRRALLDRAPDLREARRLMRGDAEALLAALRADPFDPAALDAAMATMRGRLEAQLALGGEALRGLLLGMEPAERLAFADRLEKSLRRDAARPGEGDRKGDDHKEGDQKHGDD